MTANRSGRRPPVLNALTVDVEDYFHVQAFAGRIDPSDWASLRPRVERNTVRLLDLFGEAQVSATFFTLGWVAERHPGLVRRILAAGHEVASHGHGHRPARELGPDGFRTDVRRAKAALEDIGGAPVGGYRAPTFSLGPNTPWAWEVLADEGHTYSSSTCPIAHDLYGAPDAPRFAHSPAGDHGVPEYPVATIQLYGRNVPCGGGGWFRLLPYRVSRWGLRRLNRIDRRPAIFYLHPWEIDPGQPRIEGLGPKARLRHYVNLGRTEARLKRLLADFHWDRLDRVFTHPPV